MFGAGAMCVVPEPTMLTKAGCIFLGTHSLDTVQAALRQIWTGRNIPTDTYNNVVTLAQMLGADRKTAMNVGMTVDLAIPVGIALAAGAMRVVAVRTGRIKLAAHESLSAQGTGGHTLERHVGKTPQELMARLEQRPGLTATSSFRNITEAEKFTTGVLRAHKHQLMVLVKNTPKGAHLRKTFVHPFSTKTGIAVDRASGKISDCYKVSVTIELTWYQGKPFYILTSFPMV
ncbi:RNase A-like domain-containing protein [Erwinia psidii]|uniref:RNase A-like domain-containing protein n=1 Tax=Erwinia psidii TaxID=69224 RepID=UPI002B480B56|nr:RNase A-like domain-containing protein [Erwinia psidii]